MQNQFAIAGIGVALRQALITSGDKPNNTTTILNGEYSESFAAHDCIEVLLSFIFAAAATGTIVIQRSSVASFATVETHETVTITASLFQSWAAGETLGGFYRVLNSSGQTLTVYLNKRIA